MKIYVYVIVLLLLLSCSTISEGDRALRCEKKGYLKNAERYYLKALDNNPNLEDYANYAKFHANNSNYNKANSAILSGLQRFPHDEELRNPLITDDIKNYKAIYLDGVQLVKRGRLITTPFWKFWKNF